MHGEVKTPPFSAEARLHAGYLLRMLQEGERLGMPDSRPMPTIGSSCHELRIPDGSLTWRIIYALTSDAVVILEVFEKKTRATPKNVVDVTKRRWKQFLRETEDK
ncbi:MAG: type II toxin-antitoxin system RelE/ParE family toxin [Thermoanaerobaculia bacterium]